MKKRESYYFITAIPALVVLLALFALPFFFITRRAFEEDTLREVLLDSYTYKLLSFTLIQAVLSATISTFCALFFAAFYSHYTFPGRRAILALSQLAFTIPSILVVLAFVIWYGNAGILNSLLMKLLNLDQPPLKILYSFKAILLAHVYLNFPIAFALITEAWSEMSNREEKASRMLGKGCLYTFLHITLPKIKSTIIASWILIFLFCFSSFSIVLVLGGKPKYYTLEAEIYKRTYTDTNPASAAALSIFVFAITSLILLITSGGRRKERIERSGKELKKAKGKSAIAAFLLSLMILLFILPPLLSIVYRSFFTKDGAFTLKAWHDISKSRHGLASSSFVAIINSLLIAATSALISVFLGTRLALLCAKRNSRLVAVLASMPMAAGSVTLGLGFSFLSAYISSNSIYVSYLLVLLSHLVLTLPFTVRTLIPGAKGISEKIALSSYSLGASKYKTMHKVEIPLLSGYRRKAFAFAFALSLGEVNATLTLSEGKVATIPILLYRMINSYNYQGASALGLILLLEALLVFILGEIGGRKNGTD